MQPRESRPRRFGEHFAKCVAAIRALPASDRSAAENRKPSPPQYATPQPHDADMHVGLRFQDADALLWWIEETSVVREQVGNDRLTNLSWANVEEAARRIESVADLARRGIA